MATTGKKNGAPGDVDTDVVWIVRKADWVGAYRYPSEAKARLAHRLEDFNPCYRVTETGAKWSEEKSIGLCFCFIDASCAPNADAASNTAAAASTVASASATTAIGTEASAAAATVAGRDLHTSLLRSAIQKCVRNRLTESAVRLTMQAHGQAVRYKEQNAKIVKLCDRMLVIDSEDCSNSVLGLALAIFVGMTGTTRKPAAGDAHHLAAVAAELAAAQHERDSRVLAAQQGDEEAAPDLAGLAVKLFASSANPAQIALALLVSARAARLHSKNGFERWQLNGGAMAKVLVDRVCDDSDGGAARNDWWRRLEAGQQSARGVVEAVVGTATPANTDGRWVRPMDMVYYAADHHSPDVYARLKKELVRAGAGELPSDKKLKGLLNHLAYRNVRDHSREVINSITKKEPQDLINLDNWLVGNSPESPEAKILQAWKMAGAKVWEELHPKEQLAEQGGHKRKYGGEKDAKSADPATKRGKSGNKSIANYFSKT